jgi:hypothetical protein
MIPGLFTWFMIFSPLIFALLGLPEVLVYYMAFLTVYWAYRGIKFIYALAVGYKRMNKAIETDWMGLINSDERRKSQFAELEYVYICPIFKEGFDLIDKSILAFTKSTVGSKKITLVFAIEEKTMGKQVPNVKKIIKKYGEDFKEILYYVHPAGIKGEVTGVKGANINWATRNFVQLAEVRNESIDKYLLITSDVDQRPHPKYLSAITYKYLTSNKPKQKFYCTAVHTFLNNIWDVPILIRVFSNMLTMVVLQNWVLKKKTAETWSSYVVNLETVKKVGYWDPTVGIDDTTFYWNGIIRFHGDFSGEEVYVPTYNDAVENETFVKTHKSFYRQQLRWGWGILVFPNTIACLYRNKFIPLWRKLSIVWTLIDHQILYMTIVYMLTFALPILSFLSDEYNYSSYAYNMPRLMSYVLTVIMFFNIPLIILRHKLVPVPKDWPWWRYVWDWIENFLVTINMLTFNFIPFVQAQTELMLGRKLKKNYYATDKVKVRKKKGK